MAPTKRTNKRTVKKSPPNHVSVTERASRLFAFYLMMGSSRSLTRLHEMLTNNGLSKVTLSTLKAYSRDYHWQELIAEAQTALPDPRPPRSSHSRQSPSGASWCGNGVQSSTCFKASPASVLGNCRTTTSPPACILTYYSMVIVRHWKCI